MIAKQCIACGADFMAKQKHKKTCSDGCRVGLASIALLERKRAAVRAAKLIPDANQLKAF
jgi:predicted nucleic acid-binding Zn ribbon protein